MHFFKCLISNPKLIDTQRNRKVWPGEEKKKKNSQRSGYLSGSDVGFSKHFKADIINRFAYIYVRIYI